MGQPTGNPSQKVMSEDLIAKYSDRIRWLTDVDYGDFKRKVGMYLNRLVDSGSCSSAEARAMIHTLRTEVLFDPSGDIESTRVRVVQGLEKLRSK